MNPNHLHLVTSWLADLANTTNMPTGVDPTARIASVAVMLAETFADQRLFTGETVKYVALECPFFPSVAIIRRLLVKWREDNLPSQQVVMFPEMAGVELPTFDRSWVLFWHKACAAHVGDAERANALSLIRNKSGKAYEWLAQRDAAAALIIVKRGWDDVATPEGYTDRAQHDWADPDVVQRAVRISMEGGVNVNALRLLRAVVGRHAPANLVLIPTLEEALGHASAPDASPASSDRSPPAATPATSPGRPLGALRPEHLAIVRASNPLLQRAAAAADARALSRSLPPPAPPVIFPWHDED